MSKEPFQWYVTNFRGLKLDQSSRVIEPGQLVVATNVDLKYADRLRGRNTRVKLWDPGTVLGLRAFSNSLLYTTASTLYNRGTLLRSSWGGWFDMAVINQWAYLVNGSAFIRTDGTNAYEVGITAPTAPTVATGAAGVLTGDYYYKITFVDSGGFESNGGTASALVQPSSEKVELTAIPTGDSDEDVASRKVYRTVAGGSVYYLVDTISDNTTTTYSDNTADTSLGTTTVPTTHNKPDVDFIGICSAGDRWFAFKDSSRRLYFGLPYPNERAQPSTYHLDFPDYIRGVKSPGFGSIIVVCENSSYVLSGLGSPDTFYYVPISGPSFYTKSTKVTVEFLQGVCCQGSEGIYTMDASSGQLVSQNILGMLSTLSAGAVMSTTPKRLFLIVSDSSMEVDIGVPVYAEHESDAMTFIPGTPGGDKELGVVSAINNDDTYAFSAEFGVIVHVGSGEQAQVVVLDTYHGVEFFTYTFGYANEGDVQVITYDPRSETIYAGGTDGVHSLSGGEVRTTSKFGDSYLGHPNRQKWLQSVHFGYVSGSLIAELYVDGASSYTYSNERTIYANDTTIYANDTSIGADGQTYHNGPVDVDMPYDLSGVTFSLKLNVCGELHAPILFQGVLGEL